MKLSFQFLSALATSFLAIACVSYSSDDDSLEESKQLDVSQIVGCWKIPISDTVTEYWQFSTSVETIPDIQSRLVSIDTPSGTYVILRVTENPQNHAQVMELLAYGAYLVRSLNHEILMSHGSFSYYSTNFKVTIVDNKLTLDSGIPSEIPRVLVNVHRVDSNNDSGYAAPLLNGTRLSFGGYEIFVDGDYCTFTSHPLYRGYESELECHFDGTTIKNAGKVSFEKTGKNTAKVIITTGEEILISENHGYGFDPVNIEIDLQFWGGGYGIVRGGRVIRWGKYLDWDWSEYIEGEVTALGSGTFGLFSE